MRKFYTILLVVLLNASLFAQSPQRMSYQAVIRNSSNDLVISSPVGIRVTILQGSASGTEVYKEIFSPNPQTNANGLVTMEIGSGIPLTGTFPAIDWSTGTYFIKTEIDPTGGTNYTITGVSQLLSVPYALHAKTVASYSESDPEFAASPSNGITATNITNWTTAYGWGNHALAGYLTGSRTLNINGTTYDLTANRSWSVGTVTSVGLSMPSFFSVSGSPVTGNGALSAALVSQSANLVFASPNGVAGAPTFRTLADIDIPNLDWSKITTGKPTTLTGYGITDGVNTTGNQTIAGNKTFTGTITVSTPVNATDAATKAYVDALLIRIDALEVLNNGFIDSRDGNHYNAVKIGNQIWMAENLAYLPIVHNNEEFQTQGNNSQPGYAVYGYDGSNLATAKSQENYLTYGVLYNWWAAMDGAAGSSSNPSGVQGVCPTGWHLPSDVEWTTLENYLIANGYNYDGTNTGNKIAKSLASTTLWASSLYTGAVGNTDYHEKRNATGFTALPGGSRTGMGEFYDYGVIGKFWSTTVLDATIAWSRSLESTSSSVNRLYFNKKNGFSVRCVRD